MELIFDDYIIRGLDEFNFGLIKVKKIQKGDNAGTTREETIGYYGNLASALQKLVKDKLIYSDIDTASELLSAVNGLETRLNEAFGNIKPIKQQKDEK